ncbi:FUSC family protein [Pusillimonas sp. SM2304]|uniref:FUSC family protein n=1 Tax=Pusillimonas sp. SM2304 TaxID=3073241 RepID=UPI00287421AB|nr:FUSC family protein [Pusillimonas sp. SM2304]MDS1139717.1 FUSC family protein [Pusillimonas sp. SM2304]
MTVLSLLPSRAVRFLEHDDVRTTVQTVSAVLMAYGAMHLLPLETASWAVFSALFVVQANIGGTIDLALWRVAGALVGAVIAILLILGAGHVGSGQVTVLGVGVLVMSLISVRWPALSYGLVTVSIITVTPDIQLIESAFEKVAAITVGSCSAILACLIVFPVSAHRSANVQLANALRMSGEYIVECMRCVTDGEARKSPEMQADALSAIHRASLMWQQAGMEKPSFTFRKQRYAAMSEALLEQAGHLQQSLALADRFSQAPPSCQMSQVQVEAIQNLASMMQAQLNRLGDALAAGRNRAEIGEIWRRYEEFCQAIDEICDDADTTEEREYLMALKWACHSIVVSIDALAQHVGEARQPRKETC